MGADNQAEKVIRRIERRERFAADVARRVVSRYGRTEDWLNENWVERIVREAVLDSLKEEPDA